MLYRIGSLLVAALAIVAGLLVGTLNSEPVTIDLLWVQLVWPLGLALIGALAAGILLGLCLAWVFTVLPLRIKLRNARHTSQSLDD
jgi:uncharacterized integral membrane protein